jgi:hypothetical protein
MLCLESKIILYNLEWSSLQVPPTNPYSYIRKINPIILRSNILATTKRNIMVPNPLRQLSLLMVTKEQNIKVRILTDIANFVINMVMMSPNV